jgi:hypothetical protein
LVVGLVLVAGGCASSGSDVGVCSAAAKHIAQCLREPVPATVAGCNETVAWAVSTQSCGQVRETLLSSANRTAPSMSFLYQWFGSWVTRTSNALQRPLAQR